MGKDRLTKSDLLKLFDFTRDCLATDDEANFNTLLRSIRIFLPYKFAVCGLVRLFEDKPMDILCVVNPSYPAEWIDMYLKKEYAFVDPIMIRHFSEFIPQIWSDTYRRSSSINQEFISLTREFGLFDGVAYGLNDMKAGIISLFSFGELGEKPSNRHLGLLEIIVPHLHELLIRLTKEKKVNPLNTPEINISPREKEVLAWIQEGKTNWETSMILNISERTVKFHVSNIIEKLNAVSRSHAVAKAMEFGIL